MLAPAVLSGHLKVREDEGNSFEGCSVRLTERSLSLAYSRGSSSSAGSSSLSLSLPDIIGCHLLDPESVKAAVTKCRCNSNPSERSCYFRVIAYPFKHPAKVFLNKSARRVRKVLTFAVEKFETERENCDEACRWVAMVKELKSERLILSSTRAKRLLVMVNPASGAGRAALIFQQHVSPLLTEAGIDVTLFVSSSSGGAREYVKSVDLRRHFDGIVIISGDGLIFEVVNGLMSREDGLQAIQTPLGIIPGGSGNGLAFSINYAVGFVTGDPLLASQSRVVTLFPLATGSFTREIQCLRLPSM